MSSGLALSIAATLLCAAPLYAQDEDRPAYRDESLAPETRAADLLSRLSLEERISLLQFRQPAIPRVGMAAYNWWNEALHGVARNGPATVFPQAIGMAATWNPTLIGRQGEAVAIEARIKYNRTLRDSGRTDTYQGLTFWSPNINIFRDPRWGRGQETYGEDPYLTGAIGAAYVAGLQGDDAVYLKVAATAKHFAVHSGPEHLRHSFDAAVPERDLRETYLPAFEHLVTSARVEAVMCAYNSIDEAPCCANAALLTGILRKEWGFRGHVVSDCWAISDMLNGHKTYTEEKDAAAASLRAGCDLSCGPEMRSISDALRDGLVTGTEIDTAVFRLLLARVRLGMFSDPAARPWFRPDSALLCSAAHDSLAGRVALESMVLLSNKETGGGRLLPLSPGIARLGVVGDIADDTLVLLGNYNGIPASPVTFLRGLRERLPASTDLVYSRGYVKPWDTAWGNGHSAALTTRAMSDLAGVDTVIMIAGISAALEGEEGDTRNRIGGFDRGDRTSLNLPADQRRLLRRLRKAGKRIVLVVTSGSAVSLEEERELADAIVQVWYPGQRAGTALASLLFGDESPSGRMPVTVYRALSDLPPFESYTMDGRTYRYFKGKPLFEFGFGLSYADLSYDSLRMGASAIAADDTLAVTVKITNTGTVDAFEAVQAYVVKPDDPGTNRSLCAFSKVNIPAGQTIEVPLSVRPNELRVFDGSLRSMAVRPGRYTIEIGRSSGDIRLRRDFFVH